MLSFLSNLVSLVTSWGVEFIVYTVVDVVAKVLLKDARSDEEKRQIWMYESIGLFMCALIVGFMGQCVPYLLILFGTLTIVYAKLLEWINLRYWWEQIWIKWDDFQQHNESMEKLSEMRSHQMAPPVTMAPAVTMSYMPGPPTSMAPPGGISWVQQHQQQQAQSGQYPAPFMFPPPAPPRQDDMLPAEAWYPADSDKGKTQSQNPTAVSSGDQSHGVAPQQPRYHGQMPPPPRPVTPPPNYPSPSLYHRMPDYVFAPGNTRPMPPSPPYTPILPRGADLARRPLHASYQSPPETKTTTTFKSKVMTALGMNPYSNVPPGLQNTGQNVCFLNSILQCLANSPGLLASLQRDMHSSNLSNAQSALLTSLSESLAILASRPGTTDIRTLDPSPVRQAASCLPGTMVTHPSQPQRQQDVAEFFMWLLEALHSALNIAANNSEFTCDLNGSIMGMDADVPRHPASPRYTSATYNMLKFIYGDLTTQRIQELKTACRTEIERAGTIESDAYAEPLQRLADLEWLTYKQRNNSGVDDLFTGQIVEARQCLSCYRVAVSIQTFNILPVPLVEPRSMNGLVYLEDCFSKFGTVEELVGPDGLKCECSNPSLLKSPVPLYQPRIGTPAAVTVSPSHPRTLAETPPAGSPLYPNGGHNFIGLHRRRLVSQDSALSSMSPTSVCSPIASAGSSDVLSDSGFQDHQFKTSTPILNQNTMPVRLTDAQRRSLLRQLPECLVVQLMRFEYSDGSLHKTHRPVAIPLTGLDLTSMIVDTVMRRDDLTALSATYRYDLYALCLHVGSDAMAYGHYISYVRATDGLWYRCDDETITAVNIDYELHTKQVRENAYLLFYRKSPTSH